MTKSGSFIAAMAALWLALSSTCALASVSASVDRTRVALGDSLRLTVTSEGNEDVSDTELEPLQQDFDILQRSTSSNMSIVNGQRSHTRQLLIDLAPRREGSLMIPPLQVGAATTRPIGVTVGPAASAGDPEQSVVFEAELDRDQVYVQGQVLLTLRLQLAVGVESPGITELRLDNAFVKQLGQNSFNRNAGGRAWQVHEIRYAIFPEQSGSLQIPSQTFTARERVARRSLFDRGAGRHLRRTTEPLSLEVLPRPAEFPAGTWLPARDLRIDEQWSTPPEQLRAGESATRTVRIVGQGLQGAQLPPVLFPATDGLKYYPDQPGIEDRDSAAGVTGIRRDSAALVPTRAGRWRIPELRIPWWDTESRKLRYAVLPAREIEVAAGDAGTAQAAQTGESAVPREDAAAPANMTAPAESGVADATPWQWLAAILGLAWLATLGWVARLKQVPTTTTDPVRENPPEALAFKQLLAACVSGSAVQARRGLVNWCDALFPDQSVHSLDQVGSLLEDEAIATELEVLNSDLYGRGGGEWRGERLAERLKALRPGLRRPGPQTGATLRLYPA